MGPNDPFASRPVNERQPFSGPSPSAPSSARRAPWASVTLLGGVAGAGFGVLSLYTSWEQLAWVSLMALCGLMIARIGHGVSSGEFDVSGAWRVLLKRGE